MAGTAALAMPGIEFEAIMSKVAAVGRLDTAGTEFAELQAKAEALGASTAFSATQAGEGMTYLGMAGFSAKQILAAIPGTLDLAAAAGTDLGETANIASNILSGFGLEAGEMGRVGDVLVGTFTRSNTSLSSLGETMKYLAPIAKQAGMSLEESAAMAGLLGNIGIQGSDAGTALKAIVNRMAALPKSAADALDGLKIKTTDAEGNMRPIIDVLDELAQKTEKMGSGQRLALFAGVAGEEAGGALAALIDQAGAGAIAKFRDVLKGTAGEAKQVAKTMADNVRGDLDGLSSAWEGLNIALLFTSKGPLRELVQSASEVLSVATTWVKTNPELASTLLKVGVGLATASVAGGALALTVAGLLGPFAVLRYSITTLGLLTPGLRGLGGALLSGLGRALPVVLGGLRTLSMALLANPLGLALTALTVGAGLLIAYWEPVKAFFAGLWEGLSAGVAPVVAALRTAFAPVASFFAPVVDALVPLVQWFGALVSPVTATTESLAGARSAGIALGQALGAIPALLNDAWTGVQNWFASVTETAGTAWDGVKTLFSWSPLGLIEATWGPLREFFAQLWDGVLGGLSRTLGALRDGLGAVKGWFGGETKPSPGVPSVATTPFVAPKPLTPPAAPIPIERAALTPLAPPPSRPLNTPPAPFVAPKPLTPPAAPIPIERATLTPLAPPPSRSLNTPPAPFIAPKPLAAPTTSIPIERAAQGPALPQSIPFEVPKVTIAPTVRPEVVVQTTGRGPVTEAPSNTVTYNQKYEIVIQAAPGMDPQAVAQAVRRELAAREAADRSRSRAALHDGVEGW